MNIPVTRAAEGLDRRAFTIADLERMAEIGIIAPDERLELVGGEIVPMSPKGDRHEAIKLAIVRLWGRCCPPDFVFAPEAALRLDPRNYFEPDFIVFPRSVLAANVTGPDVLLAVEVAESSLNYDLKRKSRVYASFCIHELWVIDAARRVVHVLRDLRAAVYGDIRKESARVRLIPSKAPVELAFALDDLEEL